MTQKTINEYVRQEGNTAIRQVKQNSILPHDELNRKRMANIRRAVEEGLGIPWKQWQKMVKNEKLWKKRGGK